MLNLNNTEVFTYNVSFTLNEFKNGKSAGNVKKLSKF